MPNPIAKIFAVILITFMLYYSFYQIYKKEEDLAYINTYQVVTEFVDNVRFKGFITPKMYEDFQAKLHTGSDVLYDVEMVHKHKVYVPEYTDPTNPNSFTGKYLVTDDEFYWEQIKKVLYDNPSVPYEQRIYKLETDDYFEVYVENKTKFKSTMLFDFLTMNIGESNKVVISFPYGGMVHNQDWTDIN